MKRVVRLGDITCEESVEGNALPPLEGILVSGDLGIMPTGLNLKTYNLADSSQNITNKFHRSQDEHRLPTIPLVLAASDHSVCGHREPSVIPDAQRPAFPVLAVPSEITTFLHSSNCHPQPGDTGSPAQACCFHKGPHSPLTTGARPNETPEAPEKPHKILVSPQNGEFQVCL